MSKPHPAPLKIIIPEKNCMPIQKIALQCIDKKSTPGKCCKNHRYNELPGVRKNPAIAHFLLPQPTPTEMLQMNNHQLPLALVIVHHPPVPRPSCPVENSVSCHFHQYSTASRQARLAVFLSIMTSCCASYYWRTLPTSWL